MPLAVENDKIAVAEKTFGFAFPRAWRRMLQQTNGGDFHRDGEDWTIHPVWDDGDRKRMGRTANHVLVETEQAKKWAGFPQSGVAIANNGHGDLLVALPGSLSVHRWDHEECLLEDIGDLDPSQCETRRD